MKVQSLSITVPSKNCINHCSFCVARMEHDLYPNLLDEFNFYDLHINDYLKRLNYARDNGCNTCMITGNCEPQQNRKFLETLGLLFRLMDKPFRCIEMQTTGVLLNHYYLRFLRNHLGVNTISVSLSSFDNALNAAYNGVKDCNTVQLEELCQAIKDYGFTLRLSINLTDSFNLQSPQEILVYAKTTLHADQITFRVLYRSKQNDTPQDQWIANHSVRESLISEIEQYISEHGQPLERLEFGALKYDVDGLSTVLDEDCMSQEIKEALKYLILREDCKLYSKWDSKSSVIF